MLEFLCAAGIVLVFITVIGHGLWVMIAAILRFLSGDKKNTAATSGQGCKNCGSRHGVQNNRCLVCGFDELASATMRRKADIYATERQLGEMLKNGSLDTDIHHELITKLLADLTEINAQLGLHLKPQTTPPPSSIIAAPEQLVSKPSPLPSPAPRVVPPVANDQLVMAEIVAAEAVNESSPFTTHDAAAASDPFGPNQPIRVATPSPTPRRTFADVLQAFMEQKNIRWGELVSGILIVVSAIGLVISLRATLSRTIPYFPALLFMLITGAIHGAGIYSLRRWNLKSTSRGVLVIGTLLVPLNFLAAILLTGTGELQRATTDPAYIVAVIFGLVAFGTMTYFASRALLRTGWWRLAVAVLVPSASQLFIHRLAHPELSAPMANLLMIVPAIGFLVPLFHHLRVLSQRKRFTARASVQLFLELGLSAFAVLAPVGLLLSKGKIVAMLGNVAPTLGLAASGVLAAGLLVHRRATASSQAVFRTAGTALALLGAVLMLLTVCFAWPQPQLLIATGLVNFAILTGLAVLGDLAVLHVAAIGCLTVAYLLGWHWLRGEFTDVSGSLSRRVIETILTVRSGWMLAALSGVVGGIGAWWIKLRRREIGTSYFVGCAVIGVSSVALALYAGFITRSESDKLLATPLLFLFAICGLAASSRLRVIPVSVASAGLLLATTVHASSWNPWVREWLVGAEYLLSLPIATGTVVAATMIGLLARVALYFCGRRKAGEATGTVNHNEPSEKSGQASAELAQSMKRQATIFAGFIEPLSWFAIVASGVAALMLLAVRNEQFLWHAILLGLATLAWWCGTISLRSRMLFGVFQALATITVVFGTTAFAQRLSWWESKLTDPRHLQLQIGMLASWSMLWLALRWFARSGVRMATLSRMPLPAVDHVIRVLLTIAMLGLGWRACGRGVFKELGYETNASEEIARLCCGLGAWGALTLLVLGVAASFYERRSLVTLLVGLLALASMPFLVAGRFADDVATASALRWAFATFGIVGCAVAVCWRGGRQVATQRWTDVTPWLARPSDAIRDVTLVGTVLFVLGLTTAALVNAVQHIVPGGPVSGSFFKNIGSSFSFGIPLVALVTVLFVYAIREARSSFVLFASFVFQYLVSLACVLPAITAGEPLTAPLVMKLWQWNTVGLAVFTAIWLACRRWIEVPAPPREGEASAATSPHPLLFTQLVIMLLSSTSMAALATLALLAKAVHFNETELALGNWPSFAAIILACGTAGWAFRHDMAVLVRLAFVLVCGVGSFAALAVAPFDTSLNWWGYHTFLVSWLGAAVIATLGLRIFQRMQLASPNKILADLQALSSRWSIVVTSIVVFAALRGTWSDPGRPWWPVGTILVAMGIFTAVALRLRSQSLAYAMVLLGSLAVAVFCISADSKGLVSVSFTQFVQYELITLFVLSGGWLVAEVFWQRQRDEAFSPTFRFITEHRAAIAFGAGIAFLFFGLRWLGEVAWGAQISSGLSTRDLAEMIGDGVLGLVWLVFLFGSLWDRKRNGAMAGLYLWGLSLIACVCQWLKHEYAFQAGLGATACYVAFTGYVWRQAIVLAAIGNRMGITDTVPGLKRIAKWLPRATLMISALLVSVSLVVVLEHQSRQVRVVAGFVPLLLAGGVAAMAQKERRSRFQLLALFLAVVAAVFLGWADIQPEHTGRVWLERVVRLLMVLSAGTFVYGAMLVRILNPKTNDWFVAARRAAIYLGGAALGALLVVIGLEFALFEQHVGVPLAAPQVAAVAVVLVGLIAGLLSLAVLPGRDPFALTEKGRMAYVYGAQAVGVLLFAHIYFCKPEWFSGLMRQWWPFIVVAIAFAGVGAGELFQRMGWRVLAEPFQRSGSFLPLLPTIGMWIVSSKSEYSTVLFMIGLIYVFLSITRKSTLAGIVAGVFGNGALWSFLNNQEGFSFLDHPQLWLIPPALCVIGAAQLNRNRLSEVQLTAARYLSMIVIYLSSTSEMFIRGIGTSLWPPMVLAGLSILGVMFGIAFRIRAFLYLGASFVLLSMVSMVWHAARAVQQSWPWWAFGFLSGIAILVFFGLFEKKKTEIKALIERLRQWEK